MRAATTLRRVSTPIAVPLAIIGLTGCPGQSVARDRADRTHPRSSSPLGTLRRRLVTSATARLVSMVRGPDVTVAATASDPGGRRRRALGDTDGTAPASASDARPVGRTRRRDDRRLTATEAPRSSRPPTRSRRTSRRTARSPTTSPPAPATPPTGRSRPRSRRPVRAAERRLTTVNLPHACRRSSTASPRSRTRRGRRGRAARRPTRPRRPARSPRRRRRAPRSATASRCRTRPG